MKIIATGFGSGLSPKAPGTTGTIAACILWALLIFLVPSASNTAIQALTFIAVTTVGYAACVEYLKNGKKDPPEVVIDEWAGVLIPLMLVESLNFVQIVLAFTFFRIFDIWKPWPVSWADNLDGALGVMLDDLIAGVMAAISFLLLIITFNLLGP